MTSDAVGGNAMRINHILVDMDPTIDQQPALAKALTLAKKFNASIELFLAVHHSDLTSKWVTQEHSEKEVIASYLKTKQRWLDSYVSDVVDANIEVSTDVRWFKPVYQGIIDKVNEGNIDLVVKATHCHPTINKLFFTPNDWHLLQSCPVPLLLTKASSPDEYQHVMAAVDPHQSKPENINTVILDTSIALSDTIGATPHVAHCYEPIGLELWQDIGVGVYGLDVQSFDYKGYTKQLKEHHEAEFNELTKGYAFSDENKHLESGIAQNLLLDIVEQHNIDLMVIGSHQHSGLLGSTAEKILDEVQCDILAVKS